jgi:peptidoglycan/xylan/chitin deacetylase (PgdA/CDA1 family)
VWGKNVVSTYQTFTSTQSAQTKVRTILRNSAVLSLSLGKSIGHSTGWIRFPYYHHVFSDERLGFIRQLAYLKNFGDFISLEQVVELLTAGKPINERFFCITFDDGIKSCYDYALPILAEREISATFFIITEYTADTNAGEERICRPLHSKATFSYEYLTWQECAEMLSAGMSIGSHTCSHTRLMDLDKDEVRRQLLESKQTIEEKLAVECRHFACPWGGPDKDFHTLYHTNIAKEIGYKTFLTARRGMNRQKDSLYAIKRDCIFANWGNYQLRYFMSLGSSRRI